MAIIFDKSSSSLERFRIDLNNFGRIYGTIITGFVKSYGKVFGKDIKTHRSLLTHPDYMIGPDGLRLSSLHRYPLIEAEDGSSWYVPNIRGLIRSFPDALHFTIAELNQESYGIVKGYLLEMYLKMLLKNRTPNLIVIPEEKWPNKGGERRGPDFVVIDHVNPCVLGIEVKSRRMKLNTRFLLSDNDLISNYSDLWKAIKELPEKLSKVFELVGGYQKYKQELDKARNYPRFYLGLSGETPFMFGKLALYQSKRNAEFPLYDFTETWAVMSVETFERFIEVIVQHDRPLVEVLKDYLVDSADLELSSPMAEDFRNFTIDESKSFAFQQFKIHNIEFLEKTVLGKI